MNIAADIAQACRVRGVFVPLGEVLHMLANGWSIVDELAGDPLGTSYALMQPPHVDREAA